MITTIGLILGAYLIQEFFILWSRKRRRYYHSKNASVRHALVICSLVSLVIIGGIAVSLDEPNQEPDIKAFFGTIHPDEYATKIYRVSDYFQINGQKSDSKPTYVFLNPGTPSAPIKPPKKKRRRRKPPSS
jgi:hypothetical protein